MPDLFFLRHGPRADHAKDGCEPLHSPYKVYDSSVTHDCVRKSAKIASEIVELMNLPEQAKKNVFVHFSPYLRCCETADLLVTDLQSRIKEKCPQTVPKFQLMGDFALSEWIHDKMKNKPPFYDSTEAYQMYTPNIHMMQNKKYVSNFRPTTKLGPWNEPDISYKEFQERCKQYFQKLLATYDKPAHEHDTIIVVSHGYVISNFISHFISQPIFEEIPEISINYARKRHGAWHLDRDSLGLLKRDPELDSTLNLETDIVYYKTNFINKDELDESREYPAIGFGGLKAGDCRPRPSFRIKSLITNDTTAGQHLYRNSLCPGAKNWDPQKSKSFQVKSEFKKKVMNDEAFKKAFDITRPPRHPMSPEISPNSEPTRINSTVNLYKLQSNEEIYHPLKLRYSSASDIPVQYLNMKVNSHVSLNQFQPHGSTTSSIDLVRSPMNIVPGNLSAGSASPRDVNSDLDMSPNMNDVINRLSRVRSLQRKRPQTATPKFGIISEQDTPPATITDNKFALQFGQALDNPIISRLGNTQDSTSAPISHVQPRPSSSIRFVSSAHSQDTKQENKQNSTKNQNKTIFYNFNLDSNSSDESSDEDHADNKYMWFGQNVKTG